MNYKDLEKAIREKRALTKEYFEIYVSNNTMIDLLSDKEFYHTVELSQYSEIAKYREYAININDKIEHNLILCLTEEEYLKQFNLESYERYYNLTKEIAINDLLDVINSIGTTGIEYYSTEDAKYFKRCLEKLRE